MNPAIPKIVSETAVRILSGSRFRQYRVVVRDGAVRHNMLGAEVTPKPDVGRVVGQDADWIVQKTGQNVFCAHKRTLLPCDLADGDRVRIVHAGFHGTDERKEPGITPGCNAVVLSRKTFSVPTENPHLKDLCRQIDSVRLPDGRRGLHLLSDLRYADVSVDESDETAPSLSFDVSGDRFSGRVTIVYHLAGDDYSLRFSGQDAPAEIDRLYFDDFLPALDRACGTESRRLASVTVLDKARKAH